MPQYHDAPAQYLHAMRTAVSLYDRVQDEVRAAAHGIAVRRMLDLGVGTGETARRILAEHPGAEVVGVDRSEPMLAAARGTLGATAHLVRGDLADPLPEGPFDLVTAAFAVHHLEGPAKRGLFGRIADVLAPNGRFVMADVVVADEPVSRPAPLDPAVDHPDRVTDQIAWLAGAGLRPWVAWSAADLAVLVAGHPPGLPRDRRDGTVRA
jgi:tRNA (cmo5U34)-methyltransferase